MPSRRSIIILGSVLLLCALYFFWVRPGRPEQTITLRSPTDRSVTLTVEIASTPAARARGLMFRRSVTGGMLFTFTRPQQLSFWMKNTLVPLDILFFGTQGAFISAETMEPCKADPCRSYLSRGAAAYALEVPAGFIAKRGVGSGWRLVLGGVK